MSYFVDLLLFFCYIFVSAGLPLRRVNPGYMPWTAGEPSGLHLCCCHSLRFPRRSQFSQAVEHETSSPWPSAHPTPLLSAFDGPSGSLDHTPKATGEKELGTTTPERKKRFFKTQYLWRAPQITQVCSCRPEMSYVPAYTSIFNVFYTGGIDGSPVTTSSLTSVTPSSSDRYPWGTKKPSSSSSSSPSSSSS